MRLAQPVAADQPNVPFAMPLPAKPPLTMASFFGGGARAQPPIPRPVTPPRLGVAVEPLPQERVKRPRPVLSSPGAGFRPAVASPVPRAAAPSPPDRRATVPLPPRALDFSPPPPSAATLFERPPLTIVTRSGTATLQHSLGNGFAWDFNPLACGELAASTFLPWVRPFLVPPASGDPAPAINDSTLIVELIRVVSRPRLSVCLAVTSGVASVVTLRHNLEVKGSPASLLAARLGDSLRKHDNEDRKALWVEGSDSSPLRFKVFLGVGALFRGGGVDKTLGFG